MAKVGWGGVLSFPRQVDTLEAQGWGWPVPVSECSFSPPRKFSGVSLGLLPKLTVGQALVAATPWVLLHPLPRALTVVLTLRLDLGGVR